MRRLVGAIALGGIATLAAGGLWAAGHSAATDIAGAFESSSPRADQPQATRDLLPYELVSDFTDHGFNIAEVTSRLLKQEENQRFYSVLAETPGGTPSTCIVVSLGSGNAPNGAMSCTPDWVFPTTGASLFTQTDSGVSVGALLVPSGVDLDEPWDDRAESGVITFTEVDIRQHNAVSGTLSSSGNAVSLQIVEPAPIPLVNG